MDIAADPRRHVGGGRERRDFLERERAFGREGDYFHTELNFMDKVLLNL